MRLRDITPKSLFGRMLAIILVPIILVQIISVSIFYERHWDWVSRHMAKNLSKDLGLLIDELGKQVPEDSIITNDAGNFTSWMHHRFPFKSKMKLIGSEIGAMGMGIPAGIAASLRNHDKKVFVIVGDGGALMTGSELATASLKKAKIIVIVANNNHYGTIRYHQEVHYPKREHYATTLINPNFEEYAKSFGLKGFTINSIDQIQPTLRKAIDLNESVLIEYNMSLEINTSTTTIEELQN